MLETVAGFDWHEANLEKRQKHGVSVAEIEGFFMQPYTVRVDVEHALAEQRLRAIGKTDQGRYVFLVFTMQERDGARFIRPISARYMQAKEVEHYEKEDPGL